MKTQYIKINTIGDKLYYSDKTMTALHREDGPAAELGNGNKYWYVNGKLHRENGPAVEHINGYKSWYLNGEQVTQKEHAKQTKKVPTININGKEFTLDELNSLIKIAKGN